MTVMARTQRAVVMLDDPAPDSSAPALPPSLGAVEPDFAPESTGRTPERQRLGEAIDRRRALEAEIAEASPAVDEARRADLDATTAFYAAQRVFDRAQPGYRPAPPLQDEDSYREWAREQSEPPLPIGEARAAMEAAKDAKGTARRALEFRQRKLDELTESAEHQRWTVERVVKAVVASDPAVSAALADARRTFLAYCDARRLVDRLQNMGAVGRTSPTWDEPPRESDPFGWPLTAAWAEALAQLAADPDAPLPAV